MAQVQRRKLIYLICVLISILTLQGCTLLVTTFEIGGAATTAGSTTTAVEVAQTLDVAKTVGDVASVNETGKTLTDHVVSYLTGKDCRLFRKIKGQGDYCEPVEIILPVLNTKNKIKVFQIIEGIRPVNGHMGPKTRQAYWNYQHGVRMWNSELYSKFPKNDTELFTFQEKHNIKQTGVIGPKTTKALIDYYNTIDKSE